MVLNLYSITILLILLHQSKKHEVRSFTQQNSFLWMLRVTILLLCADMFSRIVDNSSLFYVVANHVSNFLLFSMNLVIPSLWLIYVYSHVYQEYRNVSLYKKILVGINILNNVILFLSLREGWFYSIDEKNQYIRGPFFGIPVMVMILLICISYTMLIQKRKQIDSWQGLTLALFPLFPMTGVFLQILFYDTAFMLNSLTISMLLVFLNIQSANLYTDYLTGIHNRKKFELYLSEQIKNASKSRGFGAILLDINHFKVINDTFGHDAGDQSLQTATHILSACLRRHDFIARIGGDEFAIILNLEKQEELEEIIERIKQCINSYNNSLQISHPLTFSMGYALYDIERPLKKEEFLKFLDIKMYEDKRKYK
jgi:diguanylate cyclase (GGDEF)-like protein